MTERQEYKDDDVQEGGANPGSQSGGGLEAAKDEEGATPTAGAESSEASKQARLKAKNEAFRRAYGG